MSLIDKPGLPLIYSLVKQENPTVPISLTDNVLRLSNLEGIEGERVKAIVSGRYGSGYKGRRELKYAQLDLFKLFNRKRLTIGVRAVRPIHEQLLDIYQQTGIQFGVGDVDNIVPATQELPYVTTLRASSTSAAYTGEVEVEFKERVPRLDEILAGGDYDVLIAPFDTSPDGSTRCEYITHGVDYTSAVIILRTFTAGVLSAADATTLAQTLMAVDEYPWALANATVVYNGPVLNFIPTDGYRYAQQRYTHVMVVDIAAHPTLVGSLYVHYNVME